MNETDMQIQWQDGSGASVVIGYLNPNGQQCCGHCRVSPGSFPRGPTRGSRHMRRGARMFTPDPGLPDSAIPLSLFGAFVGAYICRRMSS